MKMHLEIWMLSLANHIHIETPMDGLDRALFEFLYDAHTAFSPIHVRLQTFTVTECRRFSSGMARFRLDRREG